MEARKSWLQLAMKTRNHSWIEILYTACRIHSHHHRSPLPNPPLRHSQSLGTN